MSPWQRSKVKKRPGRYKKRASKRSTPVSRWLNLPPGRWFLRASLIYLGYNLAINIVLMIYAPINWRNLLEFGELDNRTRALYLLARHQAWHTSWEDEQNYEAILAAAAAGVGLDTMLLKSLTQAESAGNPHAISHVGACGLTQLMPDTALELGVNDPFSPKENLEGGAKYLARLLERFDGRMDLALAAYNAGPGAVSKARGIPRYRETRDYVQKIMRHYRQLKRITPRVTPSSHDSSPKPAATPSGTTSARAPSPKPAATPKTTSTGPNSATALSPKPTISPAITAPSTSPAKSSMKPSKTLSAHTSTATTSETISTSGLTPNRPAKPTATSTPDKAPILRSPSEAPTPAP